MIVFAVVLHLMFSLLVWLGIKANILNVHKYMFLVALLLPLWGVVIVLIIHFQVFFGADNAATIDVDKLKIESELYKSIAIDESNVSETAVPIEEALVVNTSKERRTIIMDVLNDEPREYVEFLQKAGNNDDTEVVHYAVTAMVEISKENDYRLQEFEKRLSADPENHGILTEYTDFLWDGLSNNLFQGQIESLNRNLFASLMRQKISIGHPSVTDYRRVVENYLKQKNFSYAAEALGEMGTHYPENEEYYLLMLNYYSSLERAEEIRRLLDEISEKHIFLSSSAKEAFAFWKD